MKQSFFKHLALVLSLSMMLSPIGASEGIVSEALEYGIEEAAFVNDAASTEEGLCEDLGFEDDVVAATESDPMPEELGDLDLPSDEELGDLDLPSDDDIDATSDAIPKDGEETVIDTAVLADDLVSEPNTTVEEPSVTSDESSTGSEPAEKENWNETITGPADVEPNAAAVTPEDDPDAVPGQVTDAEKVDASEEGQAVDEKAVTDLDVEKVEIEYDLDDQYTYEADPEMGLYQSDFYENMQESSIAFESSFESAANYDAYTYNLQVPDGITGQKIVNEARSWTSRGIYSAYYDSPGWGVNGEGVARRSGYNSYLGQSGLSFDCSGFVSRVLNDVGFRGNVDNGGDCVYKVKYGNYISSDMCVMFRYGERLDNILGKVNAGDYSDLQPGDLLGWCCLHDGGNKGNHIVIYAGEGKMVEFTGSGYKDRNISGSGYTFVRGARYVPKENSSGSGSASYTSQTLYSEKCTYKVTKQFNWHTGPSTSTSTDGSMSAGQTFTSDAVVWNKSSNNMWIKKAGEEKYVFAGLHYSGSGWYVDNSQTQYLQFVSSTAPSVDWSGCNVGGSHPKGQGINLQGTITCSNNMVSVQGEFYNGASCWGNPTSKFPASGTSYRVPASDLDYALKFGTLPASNNMTLVITVEYLYNRGQNTGTKTYEVGFSIVDGSESGSGSGSGSGSSSGDNTSSINKTFRIKSTTTLGLNVRPTASTSNQPIGLLNPGDTITCTKRTNSQVNGYYWLYGTSSTGITGWISENMNWIEEVSSTPATGYLDINGWLDGSYSGNLGSYGTVDVYINNVCVANDVNDYYAAWPVLTIYDIRDINAAPGYRFVGIREGDEFGGISKSGTNIVLEFERIIPVSGITLNHNKYTLNVGNTVNLTATVSPNNATSKKVKWTSSNNSVATVSDGVIKAVGGGNATITCTAEDGSGVKSTCSITVPILITNLSVDNTLSIVKGTTATLKPTINPSNATNKDLSWKSDKPSVAKVNNGIVEGVSEGTAIITCSTLDGSGKSAKCTVTVTDGVKIDKNNIPDENFRQYISTCFDKNKNGYLESSERNEVTSIQCNNNKIESLKGVELFPNICYLYVSNNKLKTLNINKNTKLITLQCANNSLNALDLSNNLKLERLVCENNSITALNLSKHSELVYVSCYKNKLTTLNVANASKLTRLNCFDNQIQTLDVSVCAALERLNCSYNRLTSLDVSNKENIRTIYCSNNQLKTLKVNNNSRLKWLDCRRNQLTSLIIDKDVSLKQLLCNNNKLTGVNITACNEIVKHVNSTYYRLSADKSIVSYEQYVDRREDDSDTCHTYLACDASVKITGGNPVAPIATPATDADPEPASGSGTETSTKPDSEQGTNAKPGQNTGTETSTTDSGNTSETTAATDTTTSQDPNAGKESSIETIYAPKNVKATVNVGTDYQIDLDGKTGKKFKSSNKKVATVDEDGLITVKKAGKARITFKVGKKRRTVTLKAVDPTIPKKITLNMSGTVDAVVDDEVTLTVTLPEGTKSDIKWKSSNKRVATVDDGDVTFKKKGKVTITATAKRGGKKAKVKFKVTE